jgi:hypothetical protein
MTRDKTTFIARRSRARPWPREWVSFFLYAPVYLVLSGWLAVAIFTGDERVTRVAAGVGGSTLLMLGLFMYVRWRWIWAAADRFVGVETPRGRHCPGCEYPLRGLGAADRCPECGLNLVAPSIAEIASRERSRGPVTATVVMGLWLVVFATGVL